MENLVLYRKYRPLNFSDVTSQDHIKTTLKNAVSNSRIAHAYLFTGPRGVGKTTLARIFARAVNCPNGQNGEPCNNCEICQQFLNGTSLDILEIDAASHTGVDNIRELIEHLQFAPSKAKYKVIIIDEVHMLSKGAFNALLKTLEEPPKHAIFVLATTELHKVPATIVSRTQKFDFKKATIIDLVQRLEFVCKDNHVEASPDALVAIAAAADGSFRDGLSLLDQVFNFASGMITEELIEDVLGLTSVKTTYEFLKHILSGDAKTALDFVSKLTFSGKDLAQFQKDFLEFLRKVLIAKIGAVIDLGLSDEMLKEINELVSKLDLAKLIKIIEIFQRAGSELKWSAIQSLPLELATVEAVNLTIHNPIPSEAKSRVEGSLPQESEKAIPHDAVVRNGDQASFDNIVRLWPQILEKLKDYNHSLIPSLKLAKPIRIEGQELVVTFPYKFHKDAIEQRKNRIVIDQIIEDVTGSKIMIRPVLERQEMNESNEPKDENNLMDTALKIMGGKISE